MKTRYILYLLFLVALTFGGCRNSAADGNYTSEVTADSVVTHARLLHITRAEGYTLVTIDDPWNAGRALHRYVLVPAAAELPKNLPEGSVIRTPISRALIYSSVHSSVMRELGGDDAIRGVCDAQYFTEPEIAAGVASGAIADCGSSMSPTIERVIELHPDAILLSPYQDASYGQITQLGVPLVECADYMEFTPLGRAEWIKFYGALLGREREADSVFNAVVRDYTALLERASQASNKPTVLTEMVFSGVWDVPGGQSYMARILQDAGAIYPWADDKSTGSLNLDITQVLAKAQQADVWLIKSFYVHSLADLSAANSLNTQFHAYKQKQVYVCDTNRSRLFEQFPFHPERLLADYFAIFHPEMATNKPVFFQRLEK